MFEFYLYRNDFGQFQNMKSLSQQYGVRTTEIKSEFIWTSLSLMFMFYYSLYQYMWLIAFRWHFQRNVTDGTYRVHNMNIQCILYIQYINVEYIHITYDVKVQKVKLYYVNMTGLQRIHVGE